MSAYRDIWNSLAATQHPRDGVTHRLLKLQEESGEVAQAYIGYVGANKRKGITHDEEAVAKELADVVITAMVALYDWVPSPERFMKERLQELARRIREEGS